MFVEKDSLISAFEAIDGLIVFRSSERAIDKGERYPSISLDFGKFEAVPTSENGRKYDGNNVMILTIYVEPTSDEAEQEAAAAAVFDQVFAKIIELYPGCGLRGYSMGTTGFGKTDAYAVAFEIHLLDQHYSF